MPSKDKKDPSIQVISRNRRVHLKFSILESFEAGLVLFGYEVKSLRAGKVSIEEGLVRIDKGEALLYNVHIPPYSHLSHVDYNPTRSRKLLLHKKEIERLAGQAQTQRLALVPLELYFKRGIAKISIGLAKGKKTADRREEIKKREAQREMRTRAR